MSMAKRESLVSSAGSNVFVYFVNVAIVYFLSPLLVRALGNTGYGVWEVIVSLAGYLGVLDLGVLPAIVRYVARLKAENNERLLREIISAAAIVLAVAGAVAMGLMSALAAVPHLVMGSTHTANEQWPFVAVCTGAMLFVKLPGSVFTAYLMGQQRYLVVNLWRSGLAILRTAILVLGLDNHYMEPLKWLALVTLAGIVVEYAILATLALRASDGLRFAFASVRRSSFREIFGFGLSSAMLMVAQRLQYTSIPIIISHTLGTAMVVFYAIPGRLATYANGISVALGTPIMPYFSSKSIAGLEANQEAWIRTTRAMQTLSLMMPFVLLFIGPSFITIWMGLEYGKAAGSIVPFLFVALLVEGLGPHSVTYLVGHAKHLPVARFMIAASVMGAALTVVLTRSYGLVGAAISVALYAIVTRTFALHRACRHLGLPVRAHLRVTVVPQVPALLAFFLLLALGRWLWPLDSYPRILRLVGLSGVAYCVLAYKWSLSDEERQRVRSLVRGKKWPQDRRDG